MVEEISHKEAKLMLERATNACVRLDSDGELAHDVLRLLRERNSLLLQLLRAQRDCDSEACLVRQK